MADLDLIPPDAAAVTADPEGILAKIRRFADEGEGAKAAALSQGYAIACYSNMELFGAHFDSIKGLLLAVVEKGLKDCPPAESEDELGVKLKEVVNSFLPVLSMLSAMPAPGAPPDALEQMLPVCLKVMGNPDLPMTSMMALGPLTTVIATNSESMLPYLDDVFQVLRLAQQTGNAAMDGMLGAVCLMAGSAPEKFTDNLDVLMPKLDTVYGASVLNAFWNIAKVKPGPLVPHIGTLAGLLKDPSLFMALYVLGEMAQGHAKEIEDAGIEGILSSIGVWVNLGPQAPTFFAANVFGAIGKVNSSSRDKMLQILGELLAMDAVKQHDSGAMSVVDNMKALCLESPGDLEDYLDDLRDVEQNGSGNSSSAAADAIALYEGNDVQTLHARVDNLEAAADELNGQLKDLNVDDIKAYIDAHMDKVKDFIGEVHKKLPTPVRMEIAGGQSWALRKEINLYFQCSRCLSAAPCDAPEGAEFRVRTTDWGRWLKMGFGLMHAGECLIDISSAPIAAIEGTIEAVKEIYDAYKEDDHERFESFISAPFLGAADRDYLIERLQGSTFYEKFTYDSQTAGWCCHKCSDYITGAAKDKIGELEEKLEKAQPHSSVTLQVDANVGNSYVARGKTHQKQKVKLIQVEAKASTQRSLPELVPFSPVDAGEVESTLRAKGIDISALLTKTDEDDPYAFARDRETDSIGWDLKEKLYQAFGFDKDGGMTENMQLTLIYAFLADRKYSYQARNTVAEPFARFASSSRGVQKLLQQPDSFGQLLSAFVHICTSTFNDGVLSNLAMTVFGPAQQDPMSYASSHKEEMDLLCSAAKGISDANPAAAFTNEPSLGNAYMQSICDNMMTNFYSFTSMGKPSPGFVPVLIKFLSFDHPGLQEQCVMLLSPFMRTAPDLLDKHVREILDAIDSGCGAAVQLLENSVKKDPEKVYPHIRSLIKLAEEDIDLTRHVVLVLKNFAESGHDKIVDVLDYCTYVVVDNVNSSSYWALAALVPVAREHPDLVYDRLYALEAGVQHSSNSLHSIFASILGICGKISASHAEHVLPIAINPISNPTMEATDAVGYLTEIRNMCAHIGGNVLRDYVKIIKIWERSTGTTAENAQEIIRYYEGRDAASLARRIVDIEDRVVAFNGQVVETCTNFEEVKAFLTEQISEVKEFIGDVVKTLPAPVQLSVEGKIRHSLVLHFVCCHCGPGCRANKQNPFMTVTREWNKWIKVGFTLATAGKAVLEAGLGNPLGLVRSGIDLCKGIYEAYSDDPQADFDAFIAQPFLSSAETDKLVGQLRDAEYFEQFVYDSDAGNWCCRECLPSKPLAKGNESKQSAKQLNSEDRAVVATSVLPPSPYVASALEIEDLPALEEEATTRMTSSPPSPVSADMLESLGGLGGQDLTNDAPAFFENHMEALLIPETPDAEKAVKLFGKSLDAIWFVIVSEKVPSNVKAIVSDRVRTQYFQLEESRKATILPHIETICALISHLAKADQMDEDLLATEKTLSELVQYVGATLPKSLSGTFTMQTLSAMQGVARCADEVNAEVASELGEVLQSLLNSVYSDTSKNARALAVAVPLFVKMLANKNLPESLGRMASGVIGSASYTIPRVVGAHVEEIFDLIHDGVGEDDLGHTLATLFIYQPSAYLKPENLDLLVRICKSKTTLQRASYISVYYNISKAHSGALVPYLDFLLELFETVGAMGSLLVMTLATVAAADPETASKAIVPHIDKLKRVVQGLTSMDFYYVTILCAIGRASIEDTGVVLPYIMDLVGDQNTILNSSILLQVKALVRQDRALLDPFIDKIRTMLDADAKSAVIALEIVQFYEGRDIDALANRVSEVAEEVMHIEEKVDAKAQIEAYVEDHKHDIKQFLAITAKKLPMPVCMTVEGTIRKTLVLYFECSRQESGCHHPTGHGFRTETKDWNKWIKVGLNILNAGRHLMAVADDGLEAAAATYEALQSAAEALGSADDDMFKAYLEEPFLTSEEQDHLVDQLKDAGFFDEFAYDAQKAEWVCASCIHDDEIKDADGTLVTKQRVQRADKGEPTAAPDVVAERFNKAKAEKEAREKAEEKRDEEVVTPVDTGCKCTIL